MDAEAVPPTKTRTTRYKCSACHKQFKKKEHLVEHMKISYHSAHQPRCGVCQKHCKSFESLREHLTGPLPKSNCSKIFFDQGCDLCLKIYDTPNALSMHGEMCRLSTPPSLRTKILLCSESQIDISQSIDGKCDGKGSDAIAIGCVKVGGGSDGSIDLCAQVCLVDEDENIIFCTYVQPQIRVTDYRYNVTGLTEEHLSDGMPLMEVQDKILGILYNGEPVGKLMLDGGKASLLVGHDLECDLDCLRISYSDQFLRDTAKYRPLMKTNLVKHSLEYLTRTYLGYDICAEEHDPYEWCVSVMRLYKRMRAQDHGVEGIGTENTSGGFDSWKLDKLENMTPDELYEISKSNYRCWCLDSRQKMRHID